MDARAAFVLNLDADLELAVDRYAPTRSVERAVETHADVLARSLLREGDVRVRSGIVREHLEDLPHRQVPEGFARLDDGHGAEQAGAVDPLVGIENSGHAHDC